MSKNYIRRGETISGEIIPQKSVTSYLEGPVSISV